MPNKPKSCGNLHAIGKVQLITQQLLWANPIWNLLHPGIHIMWLEML